MKTLVYFSIVTAVLVLNGCQERIFAPDLTPPAPPQGIATATGDNLITISWVRNTEADLAGYNVYVSSSYNGKYQHIGTVMTTYFDDYGSRNGTTYFYAVAAFDRAGNESPLSEDVAYDTPRPEGYDIVLNDYRTKPLLAGYDFSTYSVGPYNDKYTDVFFENYNGALYLDVWTDSDIQDMGYTTSLGEIGYSPTAGWSPTKDVRVILGHTYVVRSWDNHFAKVRITSLTGTAVTFDWAYQLQSGNTRLKQPAGRGNHTLGSGILSRS